jgi:hypothetical protein
MLRLLFEHGAFDLAITDLGGVWLLIYWTPLHFAALKGSSEMVTFLLDQGASIETQTVFFICSKRCLVYIQGVLLVLLTGLHLPLHVRGVQRTSVVFWNRLFELFMFAACGGAR